MPIGNYEVDVKLFADGALIARTQTRRSRSSKSASSSSSPTAARDHGLLYGLATAMHGAAHRLDRQRGVPEGLIVATSART